MQICRAGTELGAGLPREVFGQRAFESTPDIGGNPLRTDSAQLGAGLEVANNADLLNPGSWPNLADSGPVSRAADGQITRTTFWSPPPRWNRLTETCYPFGLPRGLFTFQNLLPLQQLP